MGYAFISYSSKDQDTVSSVNRILSDNNIDTWVAPDSIPAGEDYASCINQAIKSCSCFILLLTDNAQDSTWVGKEVERAVHYNKPIIPIETKEINLNDAFEFYLSSVQFVKIKKLDSSDKELKKALARISSFACTDRQKTITTEHSLKTKKHSDLISVKSKFQALSPDEEYYNSGRDFLLGNDLSGVKQDFKQAFSCFSEAVDKNNHPSAQYCLGVCYDHGMGVEPDITKSKKCYENSASQNNTAALYKLGLYYQYTDPNIEKAIEYYKLAADKGFSFAQCALGSCYYSGSGVAVNYNKAFDYFSLSANQNNADAQAWLGLLFINGNGFPVDYSKAKHWYELAAAQNHPLAQYVLGRFYFDGNGVSQDYVEAARLFILSASHGNVSACNKLSECYRWGYGVEKNEVLANMWMNFPGSPEGFKAQRKEILNKEFEIIRQLPVKNEST